MLMLNLRYNLRATQAVLRGCTVGLLGFARIAQAVADRLRAFGATMICCSPTTKPERFPPDLGRLHFDTSMAQSDIVGVFGESNASTRGMVNLECAVPPLPNLAIPSRRAPLNPAGY